MSPGLAGNPAAERRHSLARDVSPWNRIQSSSKPLVEPLVNNKYVGSFRRRNKTWMKEPQVYSSAHPGPPPQKGGGRMRCGACGNSGAHPHDGSTRAVKHSRLILVLL